jgi:predicted RNA binding protein YcfA (HicA-like mRNA interferase family)
MPRKIRQLKADLQQAGFRAVSGKGGHTGWRHPLLPDKLTLAGHDGDDAKPYQEKQLRAILGRLHRAQGKQP